MSITRADIEQSFRKLLARAPGENAVKNNIGGDATDFITKICLSPEFLDKFLRQFRLHVSSQMLPLEQERVVFLHIPKCGGTTLHDTLTSWYGKTMVHNERHNGLYFNSIAGLARKIVFSVHYDYYSTQLIPGHKRMISFLRDPKKRLISLYNFHRAHTEQVINQQNLQLARWANQYNIDEYFTRDEIRNHPAINNSMARYFSNIPQGIALPKNSQFRNNNNLEAMTEQALANIMTFYFIGFIENYSHSINTLAEKLGKIAPEKIEKKQVLKDLMNQNPNMRPIEMQTPNNKTLMAMDELVQSDYKVYELAKKTFS